MNSAATRVREALRERVDGERILSRIEHCTQVLLSGWEPVTDPATKQVTWVPLSKDRTAALGKVMDIQLRLLSKVLPDLKAVEIAGADGEPLKGPNSDKRVRATKLLAIMRGAEAESVGAAESPVLGFLQ